MLIQAEDILHSIYNSINNYSTQQEVANALSILEEAHDKIANPEVDIHLLKEPSTNLNRKRKKSKKGVKSGTERLKIYKEIFEEKQKKDIKQKEKDEKQKQELEKKKRQLEIEERHVALEQKKRKITLLFKDDKGSLFTAKDKTLETPEIKEENPSYDRLV